MSATTAAAAAAAIQLSIQPNSNQPNQDLASLFECPVCFDYVLPPILQVSFALILSKKIIIGIKDKVRDIGCYIRMFLCSVSKFK